MNFTVYLLVCPFVFLAGFVDAIGGGGGLISLPIYILAGLPVHSAVATNKMSATCGTAVAVSRFIKEGLINLRLAVPAAIAAIVGSLIGSHLSMLMSEHIMQSI